LFHQKNSNDNVNNQINDLSTKVEIKKFERLNIIAGSKRGRSHAHEGTPRDDDFAIDYIEESGWHIAVVADGAGSAKYSREGSRIACDVVIKTCRDKLQNNNEIDALFEDVKNLNSKPKEEKEKLRASLRYKFYEILPQAAFEAKKHLEKLSSDTDGSSLKDFSTTLLICLCKKYDDLWHFITFSIGDGAIALYGNDKVCNLSDGDSGEFAGQTRFITMNSVYKSEELLERIKLVSVSVSNFDALFMMTDGISDPKFETDSNLTNDSKWKEFYKEFEESVGIKKLTPNESSQEILKWLDFWSPGNHDDRTIVVMYK
jgi:serine/threonine protein phosphatase PrpC